MLQSVVQKRKRWDLPVMFLLVSLLLECQNSKELEDPSGSIPYPEKMEAKEEAKYISDTSKEDCLLCGDGKGTLLPLHKGEENIGVISLNTFDLAHIEINRYDDYGNLLEEPSQGISTRITSTEEDGFTFRTTEDTNRG